MICKVDCIHNIDGDCFTYSFKPHIGDLCLCMDAEEKFKEKDVGLNEIVVCERKDCINIFKTKHFEETKSKVWYCIVEGLILTNKGGKMDCNLCQKRRK